MEVILPQHLQILHTTHSVSLPATSLNDRLFFWLVHLLTSNILIRKMRTLRGYCYDLIRRLGHQGCLSHFPMY